MKTFSDLIAQKRLLRLVQGSAYSQREFALNAGLSPSVLSEALSGHHILSLVNAEKIAEAYDVSANWLIGGICNSNGTPLESAEEITDLLCEADSETIQKVLDAIDDQSPKLDEKETYSELREQLDSMQKQINDLRNKL